MRVLHQYGDIAREDMLLSEQTHIGTVPAIAGEFVDRRFELIGGVKHGRDLAQRGLAFDFGVSAYHDA